MTMTFTPQKRSSLRSLWDTWFHARLERRKAYLDVLIPETVDKALTAAIKSERSNGSAYAEIKLPGHLGLSLGGSEAFSRLACESSHHVDSILARLREEHPEWLIFTDSEGADPWYDAIRVRRIESMVTKLEEAT